MIKYKAPSYKIRIKKRLRKHFGCSAQDLDVLLIDQYHLPKNHTREDLERLIINNPELHRI